MTTDVVVVVVVGLLEDLWIHSTIIASTCADGSGTASPGRYRNSGDGVAAASRHVGAPKQGQVALLRSIPRVNQGDRERRENKIGSFL